MTNKKVVDTLVNVLQNNVILRSMIPQSPKSSSFSAAREVTRSPSSYRHCGLGLCNLPLSLTYAEVGYRVLGFDIDHVSTDAINSGNSYIDHIDCSRVARLSETKGLRPRLILLELQKLML